MRIQHFLLALFAVFVWGSNFVAIQVALDSIPPLMLAAIRFALAALPWVFILPRPKARFKYVLGFGVCTFALQFGFLFTGMTLGLSPGLSSLVLQVQVFFSMGLAAVLFKDKPGLWKICGALISFIGIGIVALNVSGGGTFLGLLITLLAALAWAGGNMFTKKVHASSPLALVVWGNLVALPFMLLFSFWMEGSDRMIQAAEGITWTTVGAIVYIVYFSTHLGYGIWGMLLNKYPTATVVPFTLLVPVAGFLGSAIFFGEAFTSWKLLSSLFIMGGLVFNLFEKQVTRLIQRFRKSY